jgi:hypothetical protein
VNVLRPLKPTVRLLNDFFVFDVETAHTKGKYKHWSLTGKFVFGVVYGFNYTKVIHNKTEFINEFKHPRYKDKKVFAHNLEFDLTILFGNIFVAFPDAIFNGRLISASNGNCTFANSLNIYQTSVKVIGEMIGKPKSMDYGKTDWSNRSARAKAINGCIRDCEIIYDALFQIFEQVGSIKITQASLSMDYFKRYFLEYSIEHNENTSFFFDSYYGGRCEAFRIGPLKEHAKVIDVNSMYPYAMRECKFPDPKFLKTVVNVPVSKLKYYLNNFEGCIYAEVEHLETWLGYLPVKKGGKLLFPVGRFSGCWNFHEIRFALEQKVIKILKITRVVYSRPMKSPFVNYVNTLYRQRFETTNEFSIYRIKIFMNSLYGKFAQRITEEMVYIADITKQWNVIEQYRQEKKLFRIVPFNQIRRDCFLIVGSDNNWSKDFSIPSFASYITSFARVLLLKEMIKKGRRRVIYCDTDSVFFTGKHRKDEKQLGGWKLENKLITGVYGLKNYSYKFRDKLTGKWVEKRKIKGIPTKAEKIDKSTYKYINLVKTREALRRGLIAGSEMERIKQVKGTYEKRIVLKSGKTKPIKL